ncbi:MAG: HAMP domain-containing histidine kinase [Oscillospiraceae bacterium]|nr:HAMP domain-containing histidine kinase [Oscillospiraceae bacterium]
MKPNSRCNPSAADRPKRPNRERLRRFLRLPEKGGRKALAVQCWLYITGFSVFILALLWVLQFALFNTFYQRMKLAEIRKTGREMVQAYGDTDAKSLLEQIAFSQNLRILLLDESGWILGNYDGFGTPFSIGGGGRVNISLGQFTDMMNRMTEEKLTEMSFLENDRGGEGRRGTSNYGQAVYLARLTPADEAGRYLYISSPIPPTDATVTVLTGQFVIVTVTLLVLSAAAAWLISQRVARPIVALTKAASGLSGGEFHPTPTPWDFTEISSLSRELERAAGELRRTDNYRRELVANVSHDLKTPLTVIRFYSEMIRDLSGGDPEKRTAHCGKIIAEAERLTGMVNELLELSKLELEAENQSKAPLDLGSLLAETTERFAVLGEKEGYRFETSIPPGCLVEGNAAFLSRAVYNLIANAVNFTGEDKHVFVTLTMRQREKGPAARVEVTDTGEGIAPEELEHIWDRYYKSSETHRRGVVGTGLGLSIVRTAMNLHSADFGVISQRGTGSTFWFELPVISDSGFDGP